MYFAPMKYFFTINFSYQPIDRLLRMNAGPKSNAENEVQYGGHDLQRLVFDFLSQLNQDCLKTEAFTQEKMASEYHYFIVFRFI